MPEFGWNKEGQRSLTQLLLYEEGVGKSSLISTFVSRHFSEVVPGLMTRVRLPPEPESNYCVTTIVDSQNGDAALSENSKQQQNTADAIVLVYDLDRLETFYRLENHWLPLIERYYHGEVCFHRVRFSVTMLGIKFVLSRSNPTVLINCRSPLLWQEIKLI